LSQARKRQTLTLYRKLFEMINLTHSARERERERERERAGGAWKVKRVAIERCSRYGDAIEDWSQKWVCVSSSSSVLGAIQWPYGAGETALLLHMPCRSKACMASWEEGRRGCGYGDHHRRGLSQEANWPSSPRAEREGRQSLGRERDEVGNHENAS
jgi:hypothetical protein